MSKKIIIFFLFLITSVSVFHFYNKQQNKDLACDFINNKNKNVSNEDKVIILIDVNCGKCTEDLKYINSLNLSNKLFFISSPNTKEEILNKVSEFQDLNTVIISDKSINDLFNNNFKTVYPSYYKIDKNCKLIGVNIQDIIDSNPSG